MRLMVTLCGPFDGGDPGGAEQRTFTVGDPDPAALAKRVGEWAHDVALRMAAGDAPAAVPISDVPIALWEDLTDGAA